MAGARALPACEGSARRLFYLDGWVGGGWTAAEIRRWCKVPGAYSGLTSTQSRLAPTEH